MARHMPTALLLVAVLAAGRAPAEDDAGPADAAEGRDYSRWAAAFLGEPGEAEEALDDRREEEQHDTEVETGEAEEPSPELLSDVQAFASDRSNQAAARMRLPPDLRQFTSDAYQDIPEGLEPAHESAGDPFENRGQREPLTGASAGTGTDLFGAGQARPPAAGDPGIVDLSRGGGVATRSEFPDARPVGRGAPPVLQDDREMRRWIRGTREIIRRVNSDVPGVRAREAESKIALAEKALEELGKALELTKKQIFNLSAQLRLTRKRLTKTASDLARLLSGLAGKRRALGNVVSQLNRAVSERDRKVAEIRAWTGGGAKRAFANDYYGYQRKVEEMKRMGNVEIPNLNARIRGLQGQKVVLEREISGIEASAASVEREKGRLQRKDRELKGLLAKEKREDEEARRGREDATRELDALRRLMWHIRCSQGRAKEYFLQMKEHLSVVKEGVASEGLKTLLLGEDVVVPINIPEKQRVYGRLYYEYHREGALSPLIDLMKFFDRFKAGRGTGGAGAVRG